MLVSKQNAKQQVGRLPVLRFLVRAGQLTRSNKKGDRLKWL